MTRLLLLIALALLIAWLIDRGARQLLAAAAKLQQHGKQPGAPEVDRRGRSIRRGVLVKCVTCGMHVSRDRALTVGDRYYCSAECRDADQS
ncbi:MAG: PP0621 family protein [Acidobacteriota bacterium]